MTLRRLVLLRHAKAEPAGVVVDHERPLALAGRRQAAAVGAALAATGLAPTHVLCSSSLRTRQTWEIARTALVAGGVPAPVLSVTDALYDASAGDLAAILRTQPDEASTVLVVGHEPTMSHAADVLADPASDEALLTRVRLGVPTAAWTVLELDGPWDEVAPGALRLVHLDHPA
ncbi:SixA phosphatase family protein [Cellulomonas xiejunii]|uniref:Histidine phosphatase family protein n=1 Tax=Cellulomonas xiejunii TaxID=2968083 RepID=A0ABY5KW65_9CELL|nr:histidine phosphatase family protein [Cellulomonas xiejunii]MCC2322933.1 histidine phosphatase family protein [Cellulomonas xiejunii]UUI73431.1 histidine phosphatase family protein [Cellulomonas xiejunii]